MAEESVRIIETAPAISVSSAGDYETALTTPVYSTSVPTGGTEACVNGIGGRTVNWNQLVSSLDNSKTVNGVTFTKSASGTSVTISGEGTGTGTFNAYTDTLINGHKYFVRKGRIEARLVTLNATVSDSSPLTENYSVLTVNTEVASTDTCSILMISRSGAAYNYTVSPMLIDLTAMYGSGNEPTVAQFAALFPADYYAYDAGSLVSADVSAVTSVGTNILPVNFELGGYSSAGAKITSDSIRSADAFEAQPSTTYRLAFTGTYSSSDIGALVIYYDASMTVVGRAYVAKGNTFTTSSATRYLNIALYNGYGRTFNNDIVIRQSSVTVTTYIPYMSDTISIPSTLRTAYPLHSLVDGSVYDEYDFETLKHIQRVSVSGTTVTELSTYVETDISSYFPSEDFLLDLQTGGTITFSQTQSPTLQVPNDTIVHVLY